MAILPSKQPGDRYPLTKMWKDQGLSASGEAEDLVLSVTNVHTKRPIRPRAENGVGTRERLDHRAPPSPCPLPLRWARVLISLHSAATSSCSVPTIYVKGLAMCRDVYPLPPQWERAG